MKRHYLITLSLFINIIAFAQIPQLVKNINTNTSPDPNSHSNAQKGILYNSELYFPAESNQGVELWKTNGTTPGTLLTRDLFSYFNGDGSFPRDFTMYGGNVYFFIGDTAISIGQESKIFKMDATGYIRYAAGGLFHPQNMVLINNSFFFTGRVNSSSNGVELLEFDIPSGATIEHDVFPGADSSNPQNLTVKDDSLFFSAIGSVAAGRELWVYANGNLTQMDINPGAGSSNPSYLTVYNNELYFSADNGTDGKELMKADVPGLSATLIKDINSGAASSNPKNITAFNGNLYFSADDGGNGVELWQSDGTNVNTILFEDINAFGDSNPGDGSGFVAAGSKLYFAADDGNADIELWETDGTLGNTVLSADINPFGSSNPSSLIALNNDLIFVADDGINGDELWKYDGSNASLIQDIQPAGYPDKPYTINSFNNKIYFVADNGIIGKELWSTDGNTASLVKDINIGTSGNSNPYLMDTMGGFAYLGANETNNGYLSLIKTNGNAAGTTTVKPGDDAATGFQAFAYNKGKALGNNFIFTAFDNTNGGELWKTDGTNSGTVLIKDIKVGNNWSNPQLFTKVGAVVFFTAETDAEGRELWKTDGTAGGTVLIKDINPGINSPDIDNMVAMNGKLYFIANDGTNGSELWVSDGTAVGTTMVKDINPGAADALVRGIQNLKAINNVLYFGADDGVNGTELWKSDGTNAGTVLIKDIYPGSNSSNPQWFAELSGQIYFNANDNTGSHLFRSDGTTAGTNLFFNLEFTFLHVRVGNKILFICFPYAITGNNGFELWGTDGTSTFQVKDFVPGPEGVGYMFIDNFPVYQGRWYFNLDNDGINGQEAWSSDGTTSGTIMHEVNPGVASSYSTNFLGVNPMLFSSDDGTTIGRELYSLSLSVLPITGLEFNVQKQNTVAELTFKTKTEINNKGFVIEHSLNAQQYDSIGYVVAKSINSYGASYTFIDAKPADGKNYYRLKQIDFDGKINYSVVRFVDFSRDAYVKVYPNPTSDVLNISTGYNFKNASLKIYSSNAQLVKQQVVNGSGTISINIKDLPAGFYNVTVKDELHTVQLVFIKR